MLILFVFPVGAGQDMWTETECARLGGCSYVPTETLKAVIRQHEELQLRYQRLVGRKGNCA